MISGNLFALDLSEWKDQNFLGFDFNLSDKDFRYWRYLEEIRLLASFLSNLNFDVSSAQALILNRFHN